MTQWQQFKKEYLPAVLSKLDEKWDVFAPVEQEDGFRFKQMPAAGEVFLGPRKPLLPLKLLFLPEVEELFSYSLKGVSPELTQAVSGGRERVIFGALGCDIASLDILDRVFLTEPVDEAYRRRGEQATLVALACVGEGPECFCTSFGIDPLQPKGADVILVTLANDTPQSEKKETKQKFCGGAGGSFPKEPPARRRQEVFLLKAFSKKGKRLVEALRPLLTEAPQSDIAQLTDLSSNSRGDVPADSLPREESELWDLPLWKNLASRCLGCGVCTLLCPTCYCFDVEDERCGAAGKRFRAWDSCMSSCFTKMAGGDNPRPTKVERVRQRFLHKLSYYPREKESVACVGCGRCTVHCPVGISIEDVILEINRFLASGGEGGVFEKLPPSTPQKTFVDSAGQVSRTPGGKHE
ncbi:MAG: 4Fe-4S dicluster domain-containing protein [Candidatus Aminicenantes bacterium]|nr:4Fe-4S dicluster domain-containing protein [Candidatus Aminicenantes bacterium]